MGSNETTVNTGLLAGAFGVIAWWVVARVYGVEAPPEVVASSVTLFTALFSVSLRRSLERRAMVKLSTLKSTPTMILITLAMFAATWAHGFHTGQQHERTATQARLVTTMQAMAERATELARDDAAALQKAEERHRLTSAKMNRLSEQVTDYVATYSPLDQCVLDDRGLQLWNAANSATATDTSGAIDGAVRSVAGGEVGRIAGSATQPRGGGEAIP